jgi:aminocarboxymuconate-semialdehyde decarboxylase
VIFDVHAHLYPPEYDRLTETLGLDGLNYRSSGARSLAAPAIRREEDVSVRLAAMDAADVERQILSINVAPYLTKRDDAVRAARLANDLTAKFCAAHPDRFSFWASLPLPHVAEAIAEADRAVDDLGAVGVTIQCSCLGESIAREAFDPLYEALNRRGSIIFLHPCQNALNAPLIGDWGLTVCAGASMEDAVAAMHIIARDHPARYPDLRFIVPHFGGILPMLLERLDGQMPRAGLAAPPSETARKFFYDTVGWGSKAALLAAVTAFGAAQLAPGSDWPILLRWETYAQTFAHIREGGLDPADVHRILHVNAQQLVGPFVERAAPILRRLSKSAAVSSA